MRSIAVKHNIEVAHRLFELPGKCEQIHGHSMWVTMHLVGRVNDLGILAGIEYGDLKKLFRRYLDTEYDHRLLLNASDPFAGPIMQMYRDGDDQFQVNGEQTFLPGLNAVMGDPTTENISKWIAKDMESELLRNIPQQFDMLSSINVEVWETSVNCASYGVAL